MNLIQLQPDDVLVVRHPSHLNRPQLDAMLAQLRSALGEAQRVMILDGGQEIDVLRGVDAEAKDETEYLLSSKANAARLAEGMAQAGLGQREVQHVDTPDEEPAGIPPHVWLYRNMLTEQQLVAPLGRDETNGQYAVAIDQLTEEQWYVPHILDQIALRSDSYGTEARDLLPSARARIVGEA